ncbi:MAG: hypothetical protein ACLP9K_04100, partial [Nitrososphaerales archaeon]
TGWRRTPTNEIRDLIINARKEAVKKMDMIAKAAVEGLKEYLEKEQAKALDEIDKVVKVVTEMAGVQAGIYEKIQPIQYVTERDAPGAVMVKFGDQGIVNMAFDYPNVLMEGYIVLRKAEKQPQEEGQQQ